MIAETTRLPAPIPVFPFQETTTLNAGAFHVAGLLIHLATVFLVFGFLNAVVRNLAGACAGALFFAIHPLQVEPVVWISAMNYPLGGLWAVAALWLYREFARAVDRQWSPRAGLTYAAALLCFALSLTALPLAVGLPFAALAIDHWIIGRKIGQVLRSLALWFVLAAGWVVVTSIAMNAPSPPEVTHVPVWTRLFVAGDAVAFYLAKLFVPVSLGMDYGRTPAFIQTHALFWCELLVPVGITAALWRFVRDPFYKGIWLVFLAGLLPVLGLIPFEFQKYSTVADRYMYLALLAPSLLIARVVSARPLTVRILAACSIGVIALGALTFLQTFSWYSSITLLIHAVEVNPTSFPALNNLAAAYLTEGRPDLAIAPLRQALTLQPRDPAAHRNLALALCRVGQYDEADREIQESLALEPDNPQSQRILELIRTQANQP